MALQKSTALRNAMLAAIEAIGANPTLEIRSGPPPANAAAADTGTLLASLALPADWLAAPAAGAVQLAGVWSAAVVATGDAGHFRIKAGATCHIQGTVSQRVASGGAGDLKLDQETAGLVAGQTVSVSAFSITQGGA